jgi:cell division protein FtsW
MGMRFTVEKVERNSGDTVLLGLVILLAGLGLSMLFSASYFYSEHIYGDPDRLFMRQLALSVVGAVSMFLMYHLRLDLLRKAALPLAVIAIVFTLLTQVSSLGEKTMGARRWLYLFGFSFQPSELVKLAVVVYFSHILSKREERGEDQNDFYNSILPLLIATVLFAVPVYIQNDFSTSIFIIALCFMYLFLARIRLLYFLAIILVSLPLGAIMLFSEEYRVRRLMAFLDPGSDPAGSAYQVLASQSALARGEFWGAGLGNGVKKLGGLPEAQSDFIFAVVGEEAGFLGVLFVIGLFLAFGLRGFRTAEHAEDRFRFYLAAGCTGAILFQAFTNMAVVCGLMPATGLTLPFFSAGGSSVLIVMTMCGMLLNVSRNRQPTGEYSYVR